MNKQKNPYQFTYSGDETITMNGAQFKALLDATRQALNHSVTESYPYKFRYIDKDGKQVNKPTSRQIDSGEARKILDVEKTLNSEPHLSYSPAGRDLLFAVTLLEDVHISMVDSGVAKSYEDLQKLYETELAKDSVEEIVPTVEGEDSVDKE